MMKQQLSSLFNQWEFNPNHHNAVFDHFKRCVQHFAIGDLNNSDLYHLGTIINYSHFIQHLPFDGGIIIDYDGAETAYKNDTAPITNALFYSTIEQQKILQDMVILIYVANAHTDNYSDIIDHTLGMLSVILNRNESYLHKFIVDSTNDPHKKILEKHDLQTALNQYKLYSPTSKNINKDNLQFLVPFIQKKSIEVQETAYRIRDLNVFIGFRLLNLYNTFALNEVYPSYNHLLGFEKSPLEQKRIILTNGLTNSAKMWNDEFNNIDELNENIVTLMQNIFPQHAKKFTMPRPRPR